VLVSAGILFGWDKALYSIIFQFTSTQALNIFYKRYSKTTLLIVTDFPDEIYAVIKAETNHTATIFEGKGEYSGKNHKLLYTVVSSDESGRLEKKIRETDSSAFINVLQSKEIVGRFFKRGKD
ncbi:YitT family protein, partial [Treponema sp.]|uniref:YitT family protein n=1 Tax=Treponema sp. TaxID=166 RepID=UPI00388F3F66